jgi:hypothetical protein
MKHGPGINWGRAGTREVSNGAKESHETRLKTASHQVFRWNFAALFLAIRIEDLLHAACDVS